ncbi:MAG: anaerobic ribonucleoside-triphosphate reductase activating protein [Clostridia bacterium]|nr:anaerobic ribonucleoside-triphosphate reductase activating protein [Clostridia bacterium]MBR5985430.1 anaerobic ribonucleoside-triphosphate reductase activating protein [Clostridia bacterium]MBR6008598.1 anaerobic ribonucleoside-triphosphate reductase activating protein [Clostridia bacterium]MBR6499468.1 anaerobic ribonucleoside-triphosphate reductase activating protein [Clostridia bacterium]
MKIRIAGIVNDSIVDGPGFRLAVFTQGCPHNCPGCHNPETHDFNGGKEDDTERIIGMLRDNPLLDGVTLTGGDPFCQSGPCAEIAEAAKQMGLNVWAYSGWTWEELSRIAEANPDTARLLKSVDVLVDGRFELSQRTLELRFRGSRNQRLIDVPATLRDGCVTEVK